MVAASSSAPPKLKSDKPKKSSSTPKPSFSKPVKSTKKAKVEPEADAQPLSAEFVSDEAEESDGAVGAGAASGSGSDSDDSSEDEEDSDADLENVTPRRNKEAAVPSGGQKRAKALERYQPPIGMSELKVNTAFVSSPFEWDALASKPGVELWAIRTPRDLKASRLSGMSVNVPRSKTADVSGTFKYKSTTYTLSAAGSSKLHPTHATVDEEGRQPTAGPGAADAMTLDVDGAVDDDYKVEGGEEMGGMRLLVPRIKQGGNLYVAPVQISRRLIITPDLPPAQPASTGELSSSNSEPPLPSFLSTSTSVVVPTAAPTLNGKRVQPTHLMKFRNHAFGFHTPGPGQTGTSAGAAGADVEMNDDAHASLANVAETKEEKAGKEGKKDKKEKRRKSEGKVDAASPAKKKAKKSKE
ncbi:hypothetical protein IAU60_000536 [Kwoniella sp. DSM 27419]